MKYKMVVEECILYGFHVDAECREDAEHLALRGNLVPHSQRVVKRTIVDLQEIRGEGEEGT